MGTCRFSFDEITLVNHKSDTDHCDNDWLVLTWFGTGSPRVLPIPLLKDDGSSVLWDGATIHGIVDAVTAPDDATVVLTWVVYNLSKADAQVQAEVANRLGSSVASSVEPDISHAVSSVGALAAAGPMAPQLQAALAELQGAATDALAKAVDELVTGVISAIASVVEGQPDCNGEVARGVALYPAHMALQSTNTFEVEGSRKSNSCGAAPHTRFTTTLSRDVIEAMTHLPGSMDTQATFQDPRLDPRPDASATAVATTAENPTLQHFRPGGPSGSTPPGQSHPLRPGDAQEHR